MKTAAQMRALVRRHVQLWKTATHAEWRACFTPDYAIEDPVGTGLRSMGSYATEWNNMHASSLRLAEREPLPRSEVQLRQAVEDHLYFWNTGSLEAWRRRFREDAWLEDPVGSGRRPLGSGREIWDPAHGPERRVSLGCNRVIVCGMEALAHTVAFEEPTGGRARSRSNTELFAFDAEGRIQSWRVFHGDEEV